MGPNDARRIVCALAAFSCIFPVHLLVLTVHLLVLTDDF
jgi:hypothetical protein